MTCPYCRSNDSRVVDSRTVNRDGSIRRRRECQACQRRFTTYEYIMTQPLLVVKKTVSGWRMTVSVWSRASILRVTSGPCRPNR